MSRDMRKNYYNRDWERDRERDREYRRPLPPKRSHSPLVKEEKRRSRSPPRIKLDKDMLDENILSEISKLPEPSELWEPNQFQDAGFAPPPPFPPPPEPNPPYNNYPPQPYPGIYDDFPSVSSIPPAPQAPEIGSWNQLSLPPPPTAPPQFNIEDQIKKEAAIESEMRHQKAALSKQREDYMKKAGILKKELETLKDQRNELRGDPKRSPSPDTKRFLKENTKLQLEIQNKLKTINNVVDMLNGIIGEEAAETVRDSDDSGEREKVSKRKSRSPSNKKFNYVYYDPEMHWCRVCNEFPSTAKDYLNHLHSQAHQKMAAAHMEAPWHSVTTVNEGFPSFPSAPTKRTPIRGLQFFVPSTAWYCKLCDQFIGDLHCASAHLKSVTHSKNYTNFVEQNPHWETDWMSDRQKAFEKARGSKPKRDEEASKAAAAAVAAATASANRYAAHTITFNKDGFHTKRKDSPPPPAEEKKKKKEKKEKKKKSKRKKSTSSSSSSSSSSSDSDATAKKRKKRQAEARLNESDRQLLDSLKSRMTRDRDPPPRDQRDPRDPRDIRDLCDRASADSRKSRPERRWRERGESRGKSREGSRQRGESRPRDARRSPSRKPDIRKMPFIGKMPVYKNLSKATKNEEQKKEEQKKKEDDESTKKRREEMDAEIQKKVAEFKEKIAKAQIAQELGPPAVALPTALGAPVPFLPQPAPPPPPQPAALLPTPSPSNLSKDFQDALDIIFPSEVKKQAELAQQELFAALPFGHLGMPPFPLMQPGLLPTPQLPPGMMMGFDMNPSLFPPRPQLYDTHVPLVPSPKPRQNKRQNNNKHKQYPNNQQKHQNQNNQNQNNQKQNTQNQNTQNQNTQNQNAQNQNAQNQNTQNQNTQNQNASKPPEKPEENGAVAKKREELDELALLGIDAGDVAGM